jgi:hypothetical protein
VGLFALPLLYCFDLNGLLLLNLFAHDISSLKYIRWYTLMSDLLISHNSPHYLRLVFPQKKAIARTAL